MRAVGSGDFGDILGQSTFCLEGALFWLLGIYAGVLLDDALLLASV